ncbi:hypothetical protein C1J01_35380 [Nonomuraea aridisoli]|uniref:Alpha/beta hydrolase n=1 Tax=Nonomuraea aridisoli TaxID=2070368 RepID=A0A2W2DGQ6_9ACTN|nr:hypothetical protein C1J01_35380 [Nonomuraea aridisoli]
MLAFDRRSHGESDGPAYGQRMARHGADLAELLDVRDALLVAASMGADVIRAYADLFGTGRVRGVVSVDQTPKLVNTGDWAYGFYGLTPVIEACGHVVTADQSDRLSAELVAFARA